MLEDAPGPDVLPDPAADADYWAQTAEATMQKATVQTTTAAASLETTSLERRFFGTEHPSPKGLFGLSVCKGPVAA